MDLQLQMPFIYLFMCGFIFNAKGEDMWQAEVKWQAALVSNFESQKCCKKPLAS